MKKKYPRTFISLFASVTVIVFFLTSCTQQIPEALKETTEYQYTNSWKRLENYPIKRGRTDDLYFFDPQTGFVINSQGYLSYTEDGGETWEVKHENEGTFFRCLTFKDRKEGWLGTIGTDDAYLNSKDTIALYETKDGGDTWTPVEFIGPTPKGLCGLQKVTDKMIIGCGRVRGPSYFIKTTDGGKTWYSYDYNHLAGMLIAPYFFDEKHGFLIGGTTQDKENSRSLVLETFDGGMTWDTAYISDQIGEYCWKFSFPTPDTGFISIQRNVREGKFYHLATTNGGKTWEEKIHTPDYYYVQGVGFVDTQMGWLGGSNNWTYETRDGGETWSKVKDIGRGFNNFQFFGDSLVYGVGFGVYKTKNVRSELSQNVESLGKSGQIQSRIQYVNGKKNGKATTYFDNGKLKSEGIYRNNLKQGIWRYFDKNNDAIEKVKVSNGVAKISKTQLQKFAGNYQTPNGDIRVISYEDGQLFSQRGNGTKYAIFAEKFNLFYYENMPNVKVEFIENKEGKVIHSINYSNGNEEKAERVN